MSAASSAPQTQSKAQGGGAYQFPADLGVYWMQLKMGRYSRQRALENKAVDHDLFIGLPIPSNLGEVFGITYQNVSMGLLKPMFGTLSGVVSDVQGGKDVRKAIVDRIAGGINTMANDDNYTWALAAASSTIQNLGGEALNAGVNMAAGMIPNPNLAATFANVPLRTYSFSWRFAPRSIAESQDLINIIFSLKQRMHPELDNFALRYPDYCDIELYGDSLKNLIKFKTSVISDMRVNYAPSGIPSFFAGTQLPTEIEMSLSFNEIEIFTRKDFMEIPTAKGA